MPDQRALLLGRLASAIDGVADVASRLGPPATQARAPQPPPLQPAVVGRPWTLAAAMEPVATPIAPRPGQQQAGLSSMPPEPPPPPEHHGVRRPLTVIGSSLLGLLVIAGLAVHFLGGTSVHAPASHVQQISLTGVRPVAQTPAAGGTVPATQVSFPAKTAVVDIEVNSGGTAGQAPIQIVVTAGQPAQIVIQNAYVLNQSGDTVIPLTPPGGAFAPGEYTVTITYKGALLGATAFAVH